eukprot:419759_1
MNGMNQKESIKKPSVCRTLSIDNLQSNILHAYKQTISLGLQLNTYTWNNLDEIRQTLMKHEQLAKRAKLFPASLLWTVKNPFDVNLICYGYIRFHSHITMSNDVMKMIVKYCKYCHKTSWKSNIFNYYTFKLQLEAHCLDDGQSYGYVTLRLMLRLIHFSYTINKIYIPFSVEFTEKYSHKTNDEAIFVFDKFQPHGIIDRNFHHHKMSNCILYIELNKEHCFDMKLWIFKLFIKDFKMYDHYGNRIYFDELNINVDYKRDEIVNLNDYVIFDRNEQQNVGVGFQNCALSQIDALISIFECNVSDI